MFFKELKRSFNKSKIMTDVSNAESKILTIDLSNFAAFDNYQKEKSLQRKKLYKYILEDDPYLSIVAKKYNASSTELDDIIGFLNSTGLAWENGYYIPIATIFFIPTFEYALKYICKKEQDKSRSEIFYRLFQYFKNNEIGPII